VLNILICSLNSRARQLGELLEVLGPQCWSSGEAEYILSCDSGEMTIGAKRNLLVSKANREYCCFIDDDDMVSASYVADILSAIREGKKSRPGGVDCIGMCGYLVEDGQTTWQFRHSITVNRWCKDKKSKIYFRYPNHLNPIKTCIVKCHPFLETNFGEDKSFSDRVKQFVRSEVFVEKPLYFYKMGNK